ncbi:uncharacterized protein [Watersipora subatra]|uniref:uncharacterized protein isoform X2 n=1 Tax=Watersipora subatra TaxID=2589382 RepID=UPI00355BDC53
MEMSSGDHNGKDSLAGNDNVDMDVTTESSQNIDTALSMNCSGLSGTVEGSVIERNENVEVADLTPKSRELQMAHQNVDEIAVEMSENMEIDDKATEVSENAGCIETTRETDIRKSTEVEVKEIKPQDIVDPQTEAQERVEAAHEKKEEDGAEDKETEDVENTEDIEDGELSEEEETGETAEISPTASSTDGIVEGTNSLTTNSSHTDQTKDKAATLAKRTRKSTDSSDDQHDKGISGSSSSSDEDLKSERRRKKKEKERRKKEKKQKRKREKLEKQERKHKRKRQKMQEYEEDSYHDYNGYDNRWRDGSGRSPPGKRQKRGYTGSSQYGDYQHYRGSGRSPPGSKTYNSPPDPYASPPDESSEDEFSETLYSLVGDELMDPNVSAAEKEALFKKQQERIPGLSAGKLKKIMKKRKFQEQQRQRQRDSQRRDRREGGQSREKTQKCRYYAEGKCQKGERCQFSHNFIPAKKMEACKFFLQGYCAKGDMCIYLHSEVPCKYYHTGQKCFNAEKCKFSHDPLTDSTKPLLEKAILLEETGTFKSERPSLLGSPPKESLSSTKVDGHDAPRVNPFDPDDEEDMPIDSAPPMQTLSHIPSIFSLNIQPTRDMQEKLDAGLYKELTAPDSGSEEDSFNSPHHRPQSFYSDTFTTPNRPDTGSYTTDEQILSSPNHTTKRRWGPDLPNRQTNDRFNNQNNEGDFNRGGGDADRVSRKAPLLPIPSKAVQYNQSSVSQQQSTSTDIDPSTAQAAAANLTKILNALRSGAVQATSNSRVADPRAAPAVADPRMRSQEPQVSPASILPDPRSHPAGDAAARSVENQIDPRTQQHSQPPILTTTVPRTPPEIDGKFTRPVEFKLISVYVESRTSYIPPGAENNQEMLRDPRIKKRVTSLRQDGAPSLPSLPDITADLQRMQNARLGSNSGTVSTPARQVSRTSIDSFSDPRRNSSEMRVPTRGQGDHNSNTEGVIENGTRARNTARTSLSRVNPMTSVANYATNTSAYDDDDDEDENNSLTIDMPDDDTKSTNKPMETACT